MKRHRFAIITAVWVAVLLVASPAHAQLSLGDFTYRTQPTESGSQDHVALVMATRLTSGDPLLAMAWGCEGGRLTITLGAERTFLRTPQLVGTARFDTGRIIEGLNWRKLDTRPHLILEGAEDLLNAFLQAAAEAGGVELHLDDADGRRQPTVHFPMAGATEVVMRLRAACLRDEGVDPDQGSGWGVP